MQADWRKRNISFFGAAKSVYSQLSYGQDLTKVSLPAVFFHPYSALELGSVRSCIYLDELIKANHQDEPLPRFLAFIRWFLTAVSKQEPIKKPYNSILGEIHECSVEHETGSKSVYLAEQVSHHPPVLAYAVVNEAEQFKMQGNIKFSIEFYGNSVGVKGEGSAKVELQKHGERYLFSSALPNLTIKNVLIGSKRIAWEGDLTIECPESGYKATMRFSEQGYWCYNVVEGEITKVEGEDETVLYRLSGVCGETFKLKNEETDKEEVLLNFKDLKKNTLLYAPESERDDLDSLTIWKDVNVAIIEDDMDTADLGKTHIENAQRRRHADGQDYPVRFFVEEDGFWELRHLRKEKEEDKNAEEEEEVKAKEEEEETEKEETGEGEPKDNEDATDIKV